MFQIKNGASPVYPAHTFRQFNLPGSVNTREVSAGKFAIKLCRTASYKKSFVCSWINLWNRLDIKLKHAKNHNIFRSMIKKVYEVKSQLFNHSTNWKSQIICTQLRVGFSDLKGHLCQRGCINNPCCLGGAQMEDTHHFLLRCPLFMEEHCILLHSLKQIYPGSQTSIFYIITLFHTHFRACQYAYF